MALENADFINQLNQDNPDGLDPKSQGDDHLRVIKKAIKKTFPNITGQVDATQLQLNALLAPGVILTRGFVGMWYGDRATPPAGWLICDGTAGTPNLIDKFPFGAGGTGIGLGAVGGTKEHSHGVTVTTTVAGHALTIEQMPNHSHTIDLGRGEEDVRNPGNIGGAIRGSVDSTTAVGGNAPHSHGATSAATVTSVSHVPPFLALWFIMKS